MLKKFLFWFFIGFIIGFLIGLIYLIFKNSPALFEYRAPEQIQSVEIKNDEVIGEPASIGTFTASWYSVDGCIGCRADRLMANGRRLDDRAATCAFNHAALGTRLILRAGDKTAECKITDRIGRSERIDLTPAVFEKLAPLSSGLVAVQIIIKK